MSERRNFPLRSKFLKEIELNKYRVFVLLEAIKEFNTYIVEAVDVQDARNQVIKIRGGIDNREMIVWKFPTTK